MNRLFVSGNYVIADRDGVLNEYPQIKSVYTLAGTNYKIIETGGSKGVLNIPVADVGLWYDESGTIAYTSQSIIDFLRENTGFKLGGLNGFGIESYDLNGGLSQNIIHNKGRVVFPTFLDNEGNIFEAKVNEVDENTLLITSNAPLLGKIVIF